MLMCDTSQPPTYSPPSDLVPVWASLTERGHVHNPNKLSLLVLHYDPETVNWDGLEAALPVMESTKAGCIRRRTHSLMRNGTMDFFFGL